jgi:hypothetical protein
LNYKFELIVKIAGLESCLPPNKLIERSFTVRTMGPVVLLVLLATNSFATTAVAKSSVFPEPGLLALLGGGLVGIAALIRRHLSD